MKLVRKFVVSKEELLSLLGISEESKAEILYMNREGRDYAFFVQGGKTNPKEEGFVPHWDLDMVD